MTQDKKATGLGDRDANILKLAGATHADPFSFLGRHKVGKREVFRCFIPRSCSVWVDNQSNTMTRIPDTDLFEFEGDFSQIPLHPKIIWETDDGRRVELHDPYCFPTTLSSQDMLQFQSGKNFRAQDLLGARQYELEDVNGTLFAVWAPSAVNVGVVGQFNEWDGRTHPMRFHPEFGIWELFVPGLTQGAYKYQIRNSETQETILKSDPFARWTEQRPATASLIPQATDHHWADSEWLQNRQQSNSLEKPISVYEVHIGSWRRKSDGGFLGYEELAHQLCDYIRRLGFTHIELLPMKEHPLDESWGYQSTGYFAPTSRHGKPDDFRAFVDHCHQQGIGVILDWVPAHFPRDEHALSRFDGTALFEYPDPWKAEQKDWGTLVFNYERSEVRSFLVSSALYWLQEFHLDGLRVDAVASMLYLDFSRQAEQWAPNRYGGNHNLEAIEFLRELNGAVRQHCPGCLMIAEESSDWHGVTHELDTGGLGFHLKWNMGWMHDTLNYMSKDPIHRKHHQDWLTFGPVYAFDENFILPLSHDEVVHLKKSLFGRMPGDEWQAFANLRLLYSYQWAYPGKQLLFMGGEFAQTGEWDSNTELPWSRSEEGSAEGIRHLLTALNRLQIDHPALTQWDCDARGFEWLDGNDAENSVISFLRNSREESLVVVLNFTPEPRNAYRIPLAEPGIYREVFNSDAAQFGGSDFLNSGNIESTTEELGGRAQSLQLNLPPLAAVILQRQT